MIQTANPARAQANRMRRDSETFHGFLTNLIGTIAETRPVPQGFLVEQDAGWTLPTHFHRQHQFQIFVSGSGSLGRHAVAPFTVHYTSPESAYGPITAGEQGVSYFTLRSVSDTGAGFLHKPGVREAMQQGLAKKQATLGPLPPQDQTPRDRAAQVLIEKAANGLAAWRVQAPAACPIDLSNFNGGLGRFYLVCSGSVSTGGEDFERLCLLWCAEGDRLELNSGPHGADLLVLQFPEPGSPPMQ